MTTSSRRSADQGSCAADKGIVTGCGDDNEGFTTLDSGRGIAGVALMLVDSQRLARDGRLVNLEERIFRDNASISGNNSTLQKSSASTRNHHSVVVDVLTSSTCRISPGTTSGASTSLSRPLRRTTAFRARVFFSSSTIEPAWNSWTKPTQALSKSKAQITPKSTQSSRPAARIAAAYMEDDAASVTVPS